MQTIINDMCSLGKGGNNYPLTWNVRAELSMAGHEYLVITYIHINKKYFPVFILQE